MARNALKRIVKQFPFTLLFVAMSSVMIPTMLLLGMPAYVMILFVGFTLCIFLCELLIPILFK